MKYVIDLNMAQKPKLEEFLKNGNEFIITDDFFLEPFKAYDLNTTLNFLKKNTKILKKYPLQIYGVFDRNELIRKEMELGKPIKSQDIICNERTEIIRNLLKNDNNLKKGIASIENLAKEHIIFHNNYNETFIRGTAQIAYDLLKDANTIKEYKNNKQKTLSDTIDVAFQSMDIFLQENCTEIYNKNIFRENISIIFSHIFINTWRSVQWALKDGFSNATKKIYGDTYDIKYTLVSCFFDGLLTNEQWMIDCRNETLSIFENI